MENLFEQNSWEMIQEAQLNWNDALDASVTIVEKGKENLVQELLCDGRICDTQSDIGYTWVVRVELRGNSTNTVNIGSIGGVGHGRPPFISSLARDEGDDIAVGPVVVDLRHNER